MGYKELKDAYRQTKPRNRTRSTVFEDEVDKSQRRENRRQSDKKDIEEALEEELLIQEEIGLSEYLDEYFGENNW